MKGINPIGIILVSVVIISVATLTLSQQKENVLTSAFLFSYQDNFINHRVANWTNNSLPIQYVFGFNEENTTDDGNECYTDETNCNAIYVNTTGNLIINTTANTDYGGYEIIRSKNKINWVVKPNRDLSINLAVDIHNITNTTNYIWGEDSKTDVLHIVFIFLSDDGENYFNGYKYKTYIDFKFITNPIVHNYTELSWRKIAYNDYVTKFESDIEIYGNTTCSPYEDSWCARIDGTSGFANFKLNWNETFTDTDINGFIIEVYSGDLGDYYDGYMYVKDVYV